MEKKKKQRKPKPFSISLGEEQRAVLESGARERGLCLGSFLKSSAFEKIKRENYASVNS